MSTYAIKVQPRYWGVLKQGGRLQDRVGRRSDDVGTAKYWCFGVAPPYVMIFGLFTLGCNNRYSVCEMWLEATQGRRHIVLNLGLNLGSLALRCQVTNRKEPNSHTQAKDTRNTPESTHCLSSEK